MRRSLLKLAAIVALGAVLPALAADEAGATYGAGKNRFSLATGSPGELGLLKMLAEEFARRADAQMVWVKAGTGQSLKLLQDKKVDMVMVHAPAQVDKAIKDGWASGKTLIGSNEFYIVGPKSDPAGIGVASSAADAYQRIAKAGAPFVSRGDKFLVNTYHALTAPSGATPGQDTAQQFVALVASSDGQKLIRDYGRERFGEALYNDAVYARQYDR